jgi:hypothetical protein
MQVQRSRASLISLRFEMPRGAAGLARRRAVKGTRNRRMSEKLGNFIQRLFVEPRLLSDDPVALIQHIERRHRDHLEALRNFQTRIPLDRKPNLHLPDEVRSRVLRVLRNASDRRRAARQGVEIRRDQATGRAVGLENRK